jgi:hypothetical protein
MLLNEVYILEDKFPRQEYYWHGRRVKSLDAPVQFKENHAAFFGHSPNDVSFYAFERGDGNIPAAHKVKVNFNKSATEEDMMRVVKELGVTEDDVVDSGTYYQTETDYIYLKDVQDGLEKRGFDSYQDWDMMENDEIKILVVWHARQIKHIDSVEVSSDV